METTDLTVSAIGFGGATFGREIDQPTAWTLLDRALERGITLIDTAESYSKRESEADDRRVAAGARAPGSRSSWPPSAVSPDRWTGPR